MKLFAGDKLWLYDQQGLGDGTRPISDTAVSTLGASALSAVTAPATLTAAAVTVVVVGGAVYACSD
jgi:hypothetical protein